MTAVICEKNGHFRWVYSCFLYLEVFGIDLNPSKLQNMRPKQFKVFVNRALRNCFERYWTDGIKSKFGQSNKGDSKLRTYTTFKGHFKRESFAKLTDKSLGRRQGALQRSQTTHRRRPAKEFASQGQNVPYV